MWTVLKAQFVESLNLLRINNYMELVGVLAGVAVGYSLITAFICLVWGAAQ